MDFLRTFPPAPPDSFATSAALFPNDAPIASSTARNSFFLPNLLDRLLMPSSCHSLTMEYTPCFTQSIRFEKLIRGNPIRS
jgi:hypothetical protein